MANLARYSTLLAELDVVKVFSDFTEEFVSADLWTSTLTDSGTAAVGDAANGVLVLTPSDVTVADNDEAYVATTNELFQYGTNRQIYGRWKIKFHETTADVANVAVGFMNAVGANTIIDDGGGLKVSGDTLGVYKLDGGTKFVVASASSGATTVTTTNKDCDEETSYVIEIIVNDWDGVSMQVCYKVDGEYLRDANDRIIYHTVAISGSELMQAFAGIKLGAATNNDTLDVDYIYAAQTRV